MTQNVSEADPFGPIADAFVAEYREGRRPSIEEYASRYPEHADQIREFLPALVLMEKVKTCDESDEAEYVTAGHDAEMPGRELGDYRIIREVGRGGMGIVYEAEQMSLGRRVALKVLPQQLTLNAKQQGRFAREAKAAARLHHTNIVPVFGIGSQDGLSFYVMQYIHGLGLDDVLEELKRLHANQGRQPIGASGKPSAAPGGDASAEAVAQSLLSGQFQRPPSAASDDAPSEPADASPTSAAIAVSPHSASDLVSDAFSFGSSSSDASLAGRDSSDSGASGKNAYWRSVAHIGVQVADALQYAHDQGVTHRDIKPSNLLLDLRSTVWVTDFGLAKSDDQQNITHGGDLLGTLRYMPPEAFEGRSDARSDVYSLGLTLYELITLRPAFEDTDRRQLIKKVTHGEPAPICRLSPDAPRDLATVVHKAIERDPAHRYQTARELSDDLRRFVNDEPILARRASPLERLLRWSRHNKGLAASLSGIAALLFVIAVGASLAAAYYRRQEEIEHQLYEQKDRLAARNQTLLDEKSAALAAALNASRDLDASRQMTVQNLYYVQMVLAHEVIGRHRGLARTQSLLDQRRPAPGERDLRGWEWYYINSLCHRELFALAGRAKTVNGVSWSPDGARVASADSDGAVRLWDVVARTEQRAVPAPFRRAYCVAWNSAGTRLAAGGDNGVIVWDVASGDVLHHGAESRHVYGVAWNADDTRLAAALKQEAGRAGEVQVFDAATWKNQRTLSPATIGEYNATIGWSPAGNLLAVPDLNDVVVWDLDGGATERRLRAHARTVQAAVFHPNRQGILATAGRDATIKIWDLNDSQQVVAELRGHTHGVAMIAWHPDGNLLASAAWDGTARVWNWSEGGEIARFDAYPRHCFAVAWGPRGTILAAAGDAPLIKFWSVGRSKQYLEIAAADSNIEQLCFSSDGTLLWAGGSGGEVTLWDALGGERVRTIQGERQGRATVCFDPGGSRLVSADRDGAIVLWDAKTGARIRALQSAATTLRCLCFSSDGSRIAAATKSGPILLWNAETGEQLSPLGHDSPPAIRIAFSPDKNRLAAGDATGAVRVWDPDSDKPLLLQGHESGVLDLAWDSSGERLASAGADHAVRIWNAATGLAEAVLEGHSDVVQAVTWGPTNDRLLSGDVRGTLILWDPKTGRETLHLRGTNGKLDTACWSRDGRQIAANSDGRILIWDATRGYEAEQPRTAAGFSPTSW